MKRIVDSVKAEGITGIAICPETMGKSAQIGTVKEIAEFCNIAPFYYPCVDFGHVNSLWQGSIKTTSDYEDIFNTIISVCGREKLDKMHVHFSKIMYSQKGEVKHLTFADTEFGPEPNEFLQAVKKFGISPYVICESAGTQDLDSKTMKQLYLSL